MRDDRCDHVGGGLGAAGDGDKARRTRRDKLLSWLIIAGLAYLANALPQTLWRLTEVKLEVLSQMAPTIFLGPHLRNLRAGNVLRGPIADLLVTLLLQPGDLWASPLPARPLGIHAGTWGLALNLAIVLYDRRTGWTRSNTPRSSPPSAQRPPASRPSAA
ncbi:MAG: hypothetical protein OXT09_23865 [Myxococcales bacterium]|nr:hypothetical protein [Myxococcales bacterium]